LYHHPECRSIDDYMATLFTPTELTQQASTFSQASAAGTGMQTTSVGQ
jgi:hypothetical protein